MIHEVSACGATAKGSRPQSCRFAQSCPLAGPGRTTTEIAFCRPLVTVYTALSVIPAARVEEDIIALIEEGTLRWAWDIRRKKASWKRTVRIYGSSILALLANKAGPECEDDSEFPAVFETIFPAAGPTLQAVVIARAFSCCSDHILGLCSEKSLKVVKGSPWRRGPNGSPIVETASVREFLLNRRVL